MYQIAQRKNLHESLAEIISIQLKSLVMKRQKGHCLQVTDLPSDLMEIICRELNLHGQCEAYVLNLNPEFSWQITSTKLIEKRNEGQAVIVIFLPPELHTSAEDSFDVSTFERFTLSNIYHLLKQEILQQLPFKIKSKIVEIINESKCSEDLQICLYLIEISKNKFSEESLGLAIHHLGLIPDALLASEDSIRLWINRNMKVVEELSSFENTLVGKLQKLDFKDDDHNIKQNLYQFFTEIGTTDTNIWLPAIIEKGLTLDRWPFNEQIQGNIQEINFTSYGTTERSHDGYLIVNIQPQTKLKVEWETTPAPLHCTYLSYFTVEILKDGIPASEAKNIKVGTSMRKARSTVIKNLHKLELEDGLYYYRISAWSQTGSLLYSQESDSIFFIGGLEANDDYEEASKDAKLIKVTSIYEAKILAQIKLCEGGKSVKAIKSEMTWMKAEKTASKRYISLFGIRYGSNLQYALSVNTVLRRIEEEILSDAYSLGRYQLDLTKPVQSDFEPIVQPNNGIDHSSLEEFLNIRHALFHKILDEKNNNRNIVETRDLLELEDAIIEYVEAYYRTLDSLIQELEQASDENYYHLLEKNYQILSIDSILLELPSNTKAYLLAPTHPLKLLWALEYARATQIWIDSIDNAPNDRIPKTLEQFLSRLSNLNLPHILVDSDGKLLLNSDNFSAFWSIFVPVDVSDVRALVGRIKFLLGSPEADENFTTIDGKVLSRKILRYLAQHPYIKTLRINAVQPSSGAILVDTLLQLESERPDLRYILHLFSEDFRHEELGVALDELMSPSEKRARREEVDAFVIASLNTLFPKLVYSKHNLADLLETPGRFEANITLLFDTFKVSIQYDKPITHMRSNYVYGLVNEYVERFSSDEGNIRWIRQLIPQIGLDSNKRKPTQELAYKLAVRYNTLASIIGNPEQTEITVPTINLSLGPNDKNLVSQVHQFSDWVITIDRNFGLEYLDNPYDNYCPAYLLDYQPEYLSEIGHRLIISTQNLQEVERIIAPVLKDLSISSEKQYQQYIINALRSVSGRLVLKLLSSTHMAKGVIGMALARLFLEQSSMLKDMLLIPIDSHTDLFTTARQEAKQLAQELSLQRTDMLLVELDVIAKEITFHLVEVKFRSNSDINSNSGLKQAIISQLKNSYDVLRRYDPEALVDDRHDRLILSKELSSLLKFYLQRSIRYKLLDPSFEDSFMPFLDNLEFGYQLNFSQTGIVINMGGKGYNIESEGDINYHVLGSDHIQALLETAVQAERISAPPILVDIYSTTRSSFTNRKLKIENPSDKKQIDLRPVGLASNASPAIPSDNNLSAIVAEPHIPQAILNINPDVSLECDILLGASQKSKQFGILGKCGDQIVGLDLNGTNAISLFGVQGSGKSYTLGTILEMAVKPIPNINQLPKPLAAIVFHYSRTQDYSPEFVSMLHPNNSSEIEKLRDLYGAIPTGLDDILILTPEGKLKERQAEFPDIPVFPVTFDTTELSIEDWRFLMGAVGNDALYVKKMEQILRQYRNNLNLHNLYNGIAGAKLSNSQFELAHTRLDFAKEFIQDGYPLGRHVKPGRLIVVDLRDEVIDKELALGLFMVMLKIFANADQSYNKLIVFDEAHKYMKTDFIDNVSETIKEMRHKGTSVLIASQDPSSVPLQIIELSSQIILHKFSSPAWLKHLQKGLIALKDLTAGQLNMLDHGQAYVWSRTATHSQFESKAVKMEIRPRVTKHGGATIKAVDD